MSDKERKKKDGRNKDKKTKAAREAENPRKQGAYAPQQVRDASNLSDREPGAATSNRGGRK
jgi:hypothetical protein